MGPMCRARYASTTVDLARQQSRTYNTSATTLAGTKRPRLEDSLGDAVQSTGPRRTEFTRPSVSMGNGPRLAPSIIVPLQEGHLQGTCEYSQRKAISATPSSSVDPRLSLSHPVYGLAPGLIANLSGLGIKNIYPWQKNCLLGPGLLTGEKNLVYSAPTGGGKSLVADVLMLKRIYEDVGAKALLVLPYVALAQEKVRWLRNIVQGLERPSNTSTQNEAERRWQKRADEKAIRVVGLFGGNKVKATWADFEIAVCTIEKANSLINSAIEEGGISDLKAVVLDELHMIDDDSRGYLLELLSAKLLSLSQPVQIIGMSATISNINLLAEWLDAHAYVTNYRPVPIEEHIVYDGYIYPARATESVPRPSQGALRMPFSQVSAAPLRAIQPSPHKEFKDSVLNAVVTLASETALSGYGALVFCGSRPSCESNARWISKVLPGLNEIEASVAEARLEVLSDLQSLSTTLDPVLAETIPSGVAFHHAGLTTEEREIVAKAYDSGAIKVCVATCSLAAGINLPARRVILHGARMGRDFVGPAMLRQMRGRAGRKGKDEVGETYLCCRKADLEHVVDLMEADLPAITSCLNTDKRRMKRALLEIIAIRLATNRPSIDDYASKSLYQVSNGAEDTSLCVDTSLADLVNLGFLTYDAHESEYEVTLLGKAVVASSIDPDDGLFIYNELRGVLKAFVMDGDLHVLYTFTPVQVTDIMVNWKVYLNHVEGLDESGQRVMQLLGLKIATIVRLTQGAKLPEITQDEKDLARRYRRFYLALQLRDLCNEKPIHSVARAFDMPRGTVQVLAQSAQGFAVGMIKFCEVMDWGVLAAALDHFSDRLKAGARADLLSLAKITFIKSRTARVFWDNGFRTAAAVANADPEELVPILMQAQPNKIRVKEQQEDERYGERLLAKAKIIVESASRVWNLEMQADFEEE